MAFAMDMPKKLAIFFSSAAAVGIICFVSLDLKIDSSRRLQTLVMEPQQSTQGVVAADLDPCANHALDEFAQDSTGEWCYIRMYKCQDVQVPWWTVNLYGLRNSNTGDLAWGAGGKKLGSMTCAHYGQYLEVWRVAVKRELMMKKTRYSQCNDGHCKHDNFGWRYKDQHHKPASESKRQFSLPAASKGTQWKDLCLERAVSTDCIKKTTLNEDNMASVSAIFQRDVLDAPVSGCESLSAVNKCSP